MRSIVVVSMLAAIPSTGWTQTVPTPAAPTPVAASPIARGPAEKQICRSEETIGTRLGGHRVCHTKSEWARLAESNRTYFEQSNRALGSSSR